MAGLTSRSIINFIVTTPKPIFYKSLAIGVNRHTGENIAEHIISVIEDVGLRKDLVLLQTTLKI